MLKFQQIKPLSFSRWNAQILADDCFEVRVSTWRILCYLNLKKTQFLKFPSYDFKFSQTFSTLFKSSTTNKNTLQHCHSPNPVHDPEISIFDKPVFKRNIFAIAIIYKATWRFLIQLLNLVKATFFSLFRSLLYQRIVNIIETMQHEKKWRSFFEMKFIDRVNYWTSRNEEKHEQWHTI